MTATTCTTTAKLAPTPPAMTDADFLPLDECDENEDYCTASYPPHDWQPITAWTRTANGYWWRLACGHEKEETT